MDSFTQSLEKLGALLNAGVITAQEYETRRQSLVDGFIAPTAPAVGFRGAVSGRAPFARGGGVGPMRRPMLPSGYGAAVPRGPYSHPGMQAMGGASFGGYGGFGGGYGGGFGYGGFGKGKGKGRSLEGSAAIKVQPILPTTTVDDIKAIFSVFGTVTLAVIKEGMPRHAYVNFSSPSEASAAAAAGTVYLGNQPASVTLSYRPKPAVAEGAPTNGIGIFNIPFAMTHEELLTMLGAYPGFQTMKMVTNKLGQFRGYVFAYFDSVENATYAKSSLLGQQLGDQTLDVKYSNKPVEEAMAAPQ